MATILKDASTERAWAMAKNPDAAATVPAGMWQLLAEPHVDLAPHTEREWPVRWVMDDGGELVPELDILLECDHGWCFADGGKHHLVIQSVDDITCGLIDGVTECLCSDCQDDPYSDEDYDAWKAGW